MVLQYETKDDSKMKMGAMEAAEKFISESYPDCRVALLAGSVVRGEEKISPI